MVLTRKRLAKSVNQLAATPSAQAL